MKKSIFKQIFFVYVILSLVFMVVIGIYFIQNLDIQQVTSDGEKTPVNEFIGNLWLLLVLVFSISLIVFGLYIRKIVLPIKHLTRVASLTNVANMDIPIIWTEDNEIGELTKQFRVMSSNLKKSFDELHTQKELLLSIMNSINQAIWIVDENGIIKDGNMLFEQIFKTHKDTPIDQWRGVSLHSSFRNPDIIKIYRDTISEQSNITREIEFEGKICLCTTSYQYLNRNVIFTLMDISDIKSLEQMKKDLVSNVSHELKTPLTAIKGFVETMLSDNPSPEQSNYLTIIQRNTDRLIAIVNDLLTLSKLEHTTEIEQNEIVIKDFLRNIETIFSDTVKKANISLSFDFKRDLPRLTADEIMLTQALQNLIDNAIKYSGSSKINVTVENKIGNFLIKVADNGIGISPEHQKRIFERFYVVDRSRSKRMGGTGLGLSIVKHIVNMHSGDISVISEENKGTIFTISLPIN